MRDIKTLGVTPDVLSYTSDYFPTTLELMEKFIREGNAYADNTPAEEV